jgi:transcriptional regulator with XRE-family HTH domain
MNSKSKAGEPLGDVLAAIRHATRLNHTELAARLGISVRTLGRYWIHGEAPPVARRHAMVHALPELDLSLLIRFAAALDLPESVARAARRAGGGDRVQAARTFDAALFRAAELAELPPGRVRKMVEPVLLAMAEHGIDAELGLELLRAR